MHVDEQRAAPNDLHLFATTAARTAATDRGATARHRAYERAAVAAATHQPCRRGARDESRRDDRRSLDRRDDGTCRSGRQPGALTGNDDHGVDFLGVPIGLSGEVRVERFAHRVKSREGVRPQDAVAARRQPSVAPAPLSAPDASLLIADTPTLSAAAPAPRSSTRSYTR